MLVHNTAVKKNASEILETNALSKPIQLISDIMVPIVDIQPKIDVFRATSGSGEVKTIYTTPTDKDFYLTGLSVHAWGDTTGLTHGLVFVTITPKDTPAQMITLNTDESPGTANASAVLVLNFPMRGLLLEKGSAVSCDFDTTGAVTMHGYIGSDRS